MSSDCSGAGAGRALSGPDPSARGRRLEGWLIEAEQSGVIELRAFARGIRRDREAVEMAIRVEWSQGQTEGQVNRLKCLKRQMYGRAGFALLRQRVLHPA